LASFGQAVSEEKICLTLSNQKKKLFLAAMFVGRMEPNEALAKLNQTWQEASTVFSCIFHAGFFTFFFSPIGGARYTTELIVHVLFNLAKEFQRRIFF
jgi:hypothetical protein